MGEHAIEIHGLRKVYGAGPTAKTALGRIDLQVPRGAIFGLLGPNGAGKSTLINILAGLVLKTAGEARIWGFDIDDNPRQARASIGVVPQELNIDPFFTPFEALEIQAGLYGVPPAERRTDTLLAALGLADKAKAYARTLSGGMLRRLLVGKAMVHDPPILVLDEPTAGVDIELRAQLWAYVRELNRRGATIVLTTHYLEEAEELCDEIAIIDKGAVVACEPTAQILRRIDSKTLIVEPDAPLSALPETLARAGFAAELRPDGRLQIAYAPSQARVEDALAALREAGVAARDVTTEEADLADVFLSLTGSRRAAAQEPG